MTKRIGVTKVLLGLSLAAAFGLSGCGPTPQGMPTEDATANTVAAAATDVEEGGGEGLPLDLVLDQAMRAGGFTGYNKVGDLITFESEAEGSPDHVQDVCETMTDFLAEAGHPMHVFIDYTKIGRIDCVEAMR